MAKPSLMRSWRSNDNLGHSAGCVEDKDCNATSGNRDPEPTQGPQHLVVEKQEAQFDAHQRWRRKDRLDVAWLATVSDRIGKVDNGISFDLLLQMSRP